MKAKILLKALTIVSPIFVATGFVTSCNKGSSPVDPTPTPPGPTPPGPDPEPEPTTETAEDYIKDRTFALCGFKDDTGTYCGTGWILSDATPDTTTDYNYYIATNWHVKYAINDYSSSTKLGYYCSGMTQGKYVYFDSFSWEDQNKFCFIENDTTKAIDFYITKVDFGTSSYLQQYAPAAKTKLDKLNSKQASDKCINKFLKSSPTTNYATNKFYCGGYPVKSSNQVWKFTNLESCFTTFVDKGSDKTHYIDEYASQHKIYDISPQYQTNTDNLIACDNTEDHEPIGWDLTGGASGSMLITSHNNEWVVAGIYWGGIKYIDQSSQYWFSPCWSIFNSNYQDFTTPYIK